MRRATTKMTCHDALALLIADDAQPSELRHARAHAARCPRCSSAYATALRPEVGREIAALEPRAWPWLRAAILVVALVQFVIAVPWLVGHSLIPDSHIAVSHLTRDGALGLVSATVGLVTVWRPRYVYSTTLIAVVLLGLQLVAGMFDRQSNSVNPTFEIVHLPMLLIALGLLALGANLARRSTPFGRPRSPAFSVRDDTTLR